MRYALWLCVATLVVGLALGTLVIIYADTGLSAAGRMIRCSLGFFVAIVWIMAIADEVVNVLLVGSYLFFGYYCVTDICPN
jgi:sodium/potassium/calcium exchanger 6